jgi:hypothetical protein
MGNRRHHKKLRAEARARMARTGESYQQALDRIRGARGTNVALLRIDLFGVPATLATFEILGRIACVVVHGHPRSPLIALGARHVVH